VAGGGGGGGGGPGWMDDRMWILPLMADGAWDKGKMRIRMFTLACTVHRDEEEGRCRERVGVEIYIKCVCGHEVEIKIPASINRTGEYLPRYRERHAINTTVADANIR
jgi:hypothetical protein